MRSEEDWLAGTDPQELLRFVRKRASDRKLRFFACACCRRIWHLLPDPRSRAAIETGERFADGCASLEELSAACDAADSAFTELDDRHGLETAASAATSTCEIEDMGCFAASAAHEAALCAGAGLAGWELRVARRRARRDQCRILRDIVGNPFRPVLLDPAWQHWREGTIVQLATAIHDQLGFDALPVLADALEEAGCTNPEVLGHCRGSGPHIRGCWVVDLLIGKG